MRNEHGRKGGKWGLEQHCQDDTPSYEFVQREVHRQKSPLSPFSSKEQFCSDDALQIFKGFTQTGIFHLFYLLGEDGVICGCMLQQSDPCIMRIVVVPIEPHSCVCHKIRQTRRRGCQR